MKIARARAETCISDLRLDRWALGELSVDEARVTEEHVESCPVCQARHAELDRDRRAFAESAPAFPSGPKTSAPAVRRGPWGWASAAGAVALAAAIILCIQGLATESRPRPTAGTRTKGGPKLEVYVARGGEVFAGTSGLLVHPRDALRFSVSLDEPGYVAVISVDGAGVVSIYHPRSAVPDRLGVGADQALSTATELDDTLGAETLYGVFCDEPVAPTALRAAAQRSRETPAFPPGCRFDRILITKVLP